MNPKSLSSTFAVVVNDDPTQLNVLSGLIRKAGLEPCAFTSAEAALTEMSDWSGTKTMDHKALPAFIVTDLYMPGIDGWRFCRLLRSAEYAVLNQIPILVVSATFAGGEADRIADDLGAEAFLPSPVDGKQFLKQVEAILSGKRERIPLRVLIVEDSQTLSELLQKAFNSQGYQADAAFTVQAARDAFWKTAYDVALLDYHLPDGAGDTLLDAFRVQRPDCVCLMMTTDTGPELALDWMKRGAAAYLQKPFQPGYLIELCARARRERALLHVQDLLELRTRELRESKEKYRILLEESPDPIFSFSPEGHYMYVNQSFAKGVGKPVEDIIGKRIWDIFSKEEADKRFASLNQVFQTGKEKVIEVTVPRADHDYFYMTTITPIKDTAGNVVSAICSSKNITERKRAEVALRESEEKFRLTYSSSPDAVNINRLEDGLYVDINEGFIRATGYTREEVIGRTSLEMNIWHDPADRQKLVQGLQEKGYYENLEAQFQRKDGSLITALMSARVISLQGVLHILSITRDITESKVIEAKLQQAQKFDAIGTLAGGIAHDFNNLLMGIQGRTSLISWDLELSHPHREHIHAIEEYIRSATNLTQQLLGFAKGGKYEVTPVDMNELVHGSSFMFGRTKKEIRIHTKCQKSPLVVEADRGQIEQVLLNMYVNAWQAMPSEGGELYLETKIVTLDQTYCKPHQTEPGHYVKVSITDTGTGMDEATRLRIFDPFFTTKERGRGTGLGLASAYGIIKNHNGMITVYSEIGHGSTFNIYLPLSNREAHREAPREAGPIKGSETILLVDDEELIIDVGQAMLERLGYRVVVCRGGKEAIRVITDMGKEIELVILDMIMPGMDGGTTFDRIREIQPEMPVILSSGYAINGKASEIMRRGCNGFIQKPYNISELSNKIHNVLYERKK
jgi:PAS domain S-box-containing protein